MGKDWEIEEGKEVVRQTIVGGRPRVRRKRKLRIPIGIEKLLCRAAADGELKTGLLYNRTKVLAEPGLELTEEERMILTSIPPSSLETMIDRIDLDRHPRRKFMRGVVAAAVLAATTTMVDCGFESQSAGIDPNIDMYESKDVIEEMVPDSIVTGIEPDDVYTAPDPDVVDKDIVEPNAGVQMDMQGADVFEHEDYGAPTGILPDMIETDDMAAPVGILSDTVDIEELAVDTGIGPDVVDHEDAMAGTGILPDAE